MEKQDKHQEKAAAGEGHQEDQHPPQPRLLQRDVWGITFCLQFLQHIPTVKVHHKDEVILTPSDDGSRQFYDSYAVRQVIIGSSTLINSDNTQNRGLMRKNGFDALFSQLITNFGKLLS